MIGIKSATLLSLAYFIFVHQKKSVPTTDRYHHWHKNKKLKMFLAAYSNYCHFVFKFPNYSPVLKEW